MVEDPVTGGKDACKLKTYAKNKDQLGVKEQIAVPFMKVLENLLESCKNKTGDLSLDSHPSGEPEDKMHTFKIVHSKRKVGLHSQMFGDKEEFAIITMNDLTMVKKYEKERLSVRFQDMYFRNMAHNVRTPLNVVVATNENLKMELKNPD